MALRMFGVLCGLSALSLGCGSDGDGRGQLLVQLQAEETITDGLEVGQEPEDARDYGVTYTKYLVAIGAVRIDRGGKDEKVADGVYIADMMQVGEAGLDLVAFDDLTPGQWSGFGFETPAAGPGAMPLRGVSPADAEIMIAQGLTYWIEGTVNADKPVSFSLQVRVPTVFTDCQSDGEPGVSVSENGRSAASITLHGDHLWFDSFLTGSEANVVRRTQWLVDADVNGDGKVVTADLANARPETIFKGYSFAGAPIPINTALDFVRAQLATQGHVNGEGECTPTITP